jgi:hypothetical protein
MDIVGKTGDAEMEENITFEEIHKAESRFLRR